MPVKIRYNNKVFFKLLKLFKSHRVIFCKIIKMFIFSLKLLLLKLRRFTKRLQTKTINLLPSIIYNRVYVNCNESHLLPVSKKIHLRHLSSIMPDGRGFIIAYKTYHENDMLDVSSKQTANYSNESTDDNKNYSSVDQSFTLLYKVSPSVCKYMANHSYCGARIAKKSMFML